MPARHSGKVDKGWGYELIWATNELYCGKIMVFSKKGNKFSMHFHREKQKVGLLIKENLLYVGLIHKLQHFIKKN